MKTAETVTIPWFARLLERTRSVSRRKLSRSQNVVLLSSLPLFLFGCGSAYYYCSKGGDQLDVDDKLCRSSVLSIYPQKMEWNSGWETIGRRNKRISGRQYYQYDANSNDRSDAYEECMKSKGWRKK